ncbi:beta strand repeat-containing protein, partial [Moraxella osloensis]|uniref:beta strand repeat-containing protein n=1 Tax=Faucicola osloensis TaxID=34062 RepID=UPI003D06C3A9
MAIAAAGTDGGTVRDFGATAISAKAANCIGAQSGLVEAQASGALSIAIGCSSNAESGRGIAIGSESLAGGSGNNESIAIGRQAKAGGDQSIAIGGQSEAKGGSSIAIGADDLDRVASTNPPFYNQTGNNNTYNNTQVAQEFKSLTGSYLVNFEQNDSAATPGPGKRYNKTTAGEAAVSLGTQSYSADLATAVGTVSTASGIASVALGVRSIAEGKGALAIGPISSASKEGSTAIGINSTASGINSIAMGRGATASQDGSVALGSGSLANNATLNTAAYSPTGSISDITGKTDLTTLKQISVGTIKEERRITNVAPGGNDTDAVNVSQLKRLKAITDKTGSDIARNLGGGSTFNSATGAVTNPTYTIGGNNYTNVGTALAAATTEVKAGTNVAGVTKDTGNKGQAIYTVNAKGTTATAGSNAITVAGTTDNATNITDYKVDLSQGTKDSLVKADTALQTVVTQIDGENVKTINKDNNTANFVTGTNIKLKSENGGIKVSTADDVTFTKVTSETMTVNNGNSVANGGSTNYITQGNKNAVNGGDVYNAIQNTEQQYTADNSTTVIKRKPTDILTLKGGATTSTENNIQTIANADGSIAVKLAKDINLGSDGSVTAGNTKVDNTGVTITNTDPTKNVSLTGAGLNNGGNTITNVGPGVNGTDAVNVNQLTTKVAAATTEVKAGTNVAGVTKDTGEKGQAIYTVNAKGTTATAGSNAITVAGTTDNTTNITDYKVDLSQGTKDSLVKADTALQTVVTQIDGENVKTINKDNNTANFVTGTNIKLKSENGGIKVSTADDVTFTKVTSETMTVNNGNSVANGGSTNYITQGNKNAVNGGDVYNAIQNTEQQYTADNSTTVIKRKPTDILTLKGGATTSTENNIQTIANADGSIAVKLAKDINLGSDGSVTAGNTKVDNTGVTITNTDPTKNVSLTGAGLNNGGNTIT